MKNTTASTPVAVKPAQTNISSSKPSSSRPIEKILSRIEEMPSEKTVHWLNKTARTIVNHYDATSHKRKCTQTYWNALLNRYEVLSKHAQTQNAWESYCKSVNKPIDHTAVAFIA
jgi:hypothetical protein